MAQTRQDSKSSQPKRPTRRRLVEYPLSYWSTAAEAIATTTVTQPEEPEANQGLEEPSVSGSPVCLTCDQSYPSFIAQRAHFRTDWHKYNLQRRLRNREPLSEHDFDELSDLGSVESLSGSEPEDSDDEEDTTVNGSGPTVRLAEKLEFKISGSDERYLVVYRAALPDQNSLGSLASRGTWAVIMTGGGHFCAALWDVNGNMLRHKTFHRYTSRRKQGGSQAAADEARGNANRIRSAGATLRRYGEQALQKEVHALLKSWHDDLVSAQCVFVRASQRDKRDLLTGWDGSPLKKALKEDAVRNIPIPTRRATLKEAQRVYEELSTVRLSGVSLTEIIPELKKSEEKKKPPSQTAALPHSAVTKKPNVKGTDHLKKREEKERKISTVTEEAASEEVEEETLHIDQELAHFLDVCKSGEADQILSTLEENPSYKDIAFEVHYLKDDKRFEKVESAIGVLGVAAVCGHPVVVEKLLDAGVSPNVGFSPYVATKSKAVRTLFRKYWGQHPDKYDYEAAGIPSPLTEADLEEMAKREKAKRKKDREKKKEKEREKAEAAKSPEERARELRAAAAEARLLGNRCASCKKSLEGLVPFERLAYKYCSTQCVSRHREVLNNMPKR